MQGGDAAEVALEWAVADDGNGGAVVGELQPRCEPGRSTSVASWTVNHSSATIEE